ncbi:uncharacterized protein LOC144478014, partial [Augochlora pura]
TGRDNYSETLLEQKLAYATRLWDEAFDRWIEIKSTVHVTRRKDYQIFADNRIEREEDAFLAFQDYVAQELTRIRELNQPGPSNQSSSRYRVPIQLPQQRLPKYGGDPEKWDHFEDLFNSGVIKNECLSDVQRMHYLAACLEGKALAAISHLEIKGTNFEIAWTTLKNEFGLPRFVTARLLDQVTKLKQIRKGDLASLQQVTVGFKHAVAALEKRGDFEELWKWMLVHLIKLQLDDELEWEWEKSLKLSKDYPSYNE